MIFENGKSYRLETLIVYAQNKFVYAHGFKLFSTGIIFLIFFFYQLACSKFYEKFLILRARDKKNKNKKRNERYAWTFNRLYPGYTHSYMYIWYQICVKLFNFLEFFFCYQSKKYSNFQQNSLFSVPTWLRNNLATPTVCK